MVNIQLYIGIYGFSAWLLSACIRRWHAVVRSCKSAWLCFSYRASIYMCWRDRGSSIYYVITGGGRGVTSLMTTDDKGEGVVGHDDVIKKESWKPNPQYTRVPPKPRIQHYHQSCCSFIMQFCLYYCIIHGLFQFHAFCRQTFIVMSYFTAVRGASRKIAKSKLAYWWCNKVYWWCNIKGRGGWELDDVWWRRGEGGLKMVWKLMT